MIRVLKYLFFIFIFLISCSCAQKRNNSLIDLWQATIKMDSCFPGGHPWSAHELNEINDLAGEAKYKEVYAPLIRLNAESKNDIVPLLISRIGSKNETKVHICPYINATEGELAIYVLSFITRKEWFLALNLKESPDNRQGAVRSALSTKEGRSKFKNFYQLQATNTLNQ